jgi:hypothetical protein
MNSRDFQEVSHNFQTMRNVTKVPSLTMQPTHHDRGRQVFDQLYYTQAPMQPRDINLFFFTCS